MRGIGFHEFNNVKSIKLLHKFKDKKLDINLEDIKSITFFDDKVIFVYTDSKVNYVMVEESREEVLSWLTN